MNEQSEALTRTLLGNMGGPLAALAPVGFASLGEMLSNRGALDSGILNDILSTTARDTATQQQLFQGQAASQGLQNSGVAQAINAAIGQAGIDTQQKARLDEAQAQALRQRQDLQLLQQMLLDPSLDVLGIQRGVARSGGSNTLDALIGAGGSVLSSFVSK